jgi:hypothetical protein
MLLLRLLNNTPYTAWRSFDAVGYVRVGDIGIAYRKMANGGNDDMSRYRHIVHLIVGVASEVDLSFALLLADDQWMTVEECPVGMPMKLNQVNLRDLRFDPNRVRHDCGYADPLSRSLLERLIGEHVNTRIRLNADELMFIPAIVHSVVPQPCRSALELDCFVGTTGPVGYLRIGTAGDTCRDLTPEEDASLREPLAPCLIYRELSPGWPQVPRGRRAWQVYAAQLRGSTAVDDSIPGGGEAFGSADLDATQLPASPGLSRALKMLFDVRMVRANNVSADLNLTEDEALGFLWRCEQSVVAGSEVLGLSDWSLREVFTSVKSRRGYTTVSHFLQNSDYDLIVRKWRETGLGALGYASLQRWPVHADASADTALVPERRLSEQLSILIGHLVTSEAGVQQLSILLRHGFGSEREVRRLFLDSLGDDGRRFLYSRIVPSAGLPMDQLLELIRDSFADWCSFYRIPEDQGEAIRSALFRRRHQLIDTLLRRRGDPI